jgi:signal transduction histidine kinase
LAAVGLVVCALSGPAAAPPPPEPSSNRVVATWIVRAPADFSPESPGAIARWAEFPAQSIKSVDATRHPIAEAVWYQLRLKLAGDARPADLWLRISALHQRRTEAYLIRDGGVRAVARAGYAVPTGARDTTGAGFDLALPLAGVAAGSECDVWLRVEARVAPIFTPEIVDSAQLKSGAVMSWSVSLVYYSGVFFLSLVQVVLLVHFRDRVSLDYVLFSLGMCVGAVARLGHFDALFSERLGGFLLGDFLLYVRLVNTVLGLRMLMSYFDLARTVPWAHRTAKWLIWCHVGVFGVAPFGNAEWLDVATATVRLGVLAFVIVVSVRTIQLRLVGAVVTSVAWAGVILADAVLTLMLLGTVPRVPVAALLPVVGVLWEMLFNTFGLVYRFERVRDLRRSVEVKEAEARSFQRLVRVLCHDVSNPLSVIRFTIEALDPHSRLGSALSLPVALRRMRQAEGSITAIIQNVRALEALGTYTGEIRTQPVDAREAVADTLELFKERLHAKALRVDARIGDQPVWVEADLQLLQHTVLANALSNAVKFSPPGENIRVVLESAPTGHVRIAVSDRGAGLAPADRAAWAATGDVASRPGTLSEPGTGFGLRLMRDYTVLMGGRFTLYSRTAEEAPESSGTTVEILLRPAAPPVPNRLPAR